LQLYTCTWITTIEHTLVNNNLILQDLIDIHVGYIYLATVLYTCMS